MKQSFTATVWPEGPWFVAQCLEVDVASQGETEEDALANLREALELHFEPPCAWNEQALPNNLTRTLSDDLQVGEETRYTVRVLDAQLSTNSSATIGHSPRTSVRASQTYESWGAVRPSSYESMANHLS